MRLLALRLWLIKADQESVMWRVLLCLGWKLLSYVRLNRTRILPPFICLWSLAVGRLSIFGKKKNEKQHLTSILCEPPVEVLVSCDELLTPYLFPAGSLMFPIICPL